MLRQKYSRDRQIIVSMEEGERSDEMESDEPVLFSKFGLKDKKDRHLRYVLRRLGCPQPDEHRYKRKELASVWLADQHSRWSSLPPDLKGRLVSDLLNTLHRKEGGFDVLFEVLFFPPSQMYFNPGTDYSTTAEDILRCGLDHSFDMEGQLQSILDFPLKTLHMTEVDDFHFANCPLGCNGAFECICPNWCSCRYPCPCNRRPLSLALYYGRPKLVRLLLNCGARLPPEDVCRCGGQAAAHPLDTLLLCLREYADETRSRLDLLSLEMLLADAPLTLRRVARCTFWYLGDVLEEVPSLQHMARASVRQQLRVGRSIGRPDALRQCGLPRLLKSYIYLDDVIDA